MTKIIKIKVDDKEISISKLPIIKYAELLKLVKELPKYIKDMDQKSGSDLIEQLPTLISVALPDVINIIFFVCDGQVTKEEVEQMGLDDVTNIVVAIVEVNNYTEIFDRLKKVTAPKSMESQKLVQTT